MLETREIDGVRVLEMARGKVNALDLELVEALGSAFRAAPSHRPMVLTGRGSAFCAGVDLHRIVDGGTEYVHRFLPGLTEAFLAVFEYPGPVIASLNGHALAGGCILAAACDVRVAEAGPAQLGLPELVVGVPFPTTAIEILRHAVGEAHAAHLVYTGRRISPEEAHRIGLVTELAGTERAAIDVAIELAQEMAGREGPPYALAKAQLRRDTLDRISRRQEKDDPEVAAIWAAPETTAAIRRYLAELGERSHQHRGGTS